MRLGWLGVAATLAASLAGCSSLSSLLGGDEPGLMLQGHDPVAYFIAGRPMPGRDDISARHQDRSYRFATDENRRLFITRPDRYVPQFDGLSAAGMVYALPVAASPETFKIIDGRLYLFDSPRARLYFEMDQERNLQAASRYWETEVRNTPRALQALKRSVFHVPNYKSEDDLAGEYERRFGKKPGT